MCLKLDKFLIMAESIGGYLFIITWIMDCCIVASWGHRITELTVPAIADPREEAIFSCRFDMDADHLYSLKWYKDDREIYRYMPSQYPAQTSFPSAGIRHVAGECSPASCSMRLVAVSSAAAGLYRCEVSAEAPTFRIVHRSGTMLVAALPRADPVLEGVPASATPGDELIVNCTTDTSMPPPEIVWYINDVKASFLYVSVAQLSAKDEFGTSRRSQSLRLRAQSSHFPPPDERLRLRCEAVLPDWPSLPLSQLSRSVSASVPLHPAHASISKLTSGAEGIRYQSIYLRFGTIVFFLFYIINLQYSL